MNKKTVIAGVGLAVLVIAAVHYGGILESSPAPAKTEASAQQPPNPSPSAPTVELSDSQRSSIKMETVDQYPFPVEKEAVGSISFDEDQLVVSAESTLISAAATFELTSKELVRAKELLGTNGVSQRELEQATSDQQTAEAALKVARDALQALGKTDAEIDQLIAAGKIDSTLNPTKWVVANVTESDSPLIQMGQPVKVRVVSFPGRAFEGKVSKVYATVDPNTHRMPLRCEIADPKNELRPGMLASVVFQVSEPVESIAIPVNGVVREGDGTMTAWVTADRRHFVQRTIKTGLQMDGKYQVLDGLQRGEMAVTDGAIFLDNMLQAPSDDD
jgi:cobalt-zinc-cadmium efflux system membrane fusion protein